MASTNKTTHYELSQYVSSDKPTYLIDYNGDMLKIDTGINAAKTTADSASTAATNAGTAAETAQTTANTAVTNAATAQTTADGANTKIGTLANLQTTAKTDLVSAINEVNGIAVESEVVDSTSGTQTDKAPSVRAVKDLTAGHVLYSNASGTTGNITLSESAANYVRLEIEFMNVDALYDVVDIYEPDGKDVNLSIPFAFTGGVNGLFAIHSRDVSISGTSINTKVDANNGPYYGALVLWENSTATLEKTNYIKIVKVIGYKE